MDQNARTEALLERFDKEAYKAVLSKEQRNAESRLTLITMDKISFSHVSIFSDKSSQTVGGAAAAGVARRQAFQNKTNVERHKGSHLLQSSSKK